MKCEHQGCQRTDTRQGLWVWADGDDPEICAYCEDHLSLAQGRAKDGDQFVLFKTEEDFWKEMWS